MAPPKRPWFRLYTESIWDRKIRRLRPEHRWLWVSMLALARQSPVPGFLMLDEAEPLKPEDIEDAAAMKPKDVEVGTNALRAAGLIDHDAALDAWFFPTWNDRQFESDETAKRTAKHRSKQQGRNVPSPDDVAPPETETEAETEKKPLSPAPQDDAEIAEAFAAFWEKYPARNGKKIGKAKTERAFKRLSKINRQRAMVAVGHYAAACNSGVTIAKDPFRFLDPDFFDAWETPASGESSGPDLCEHQVPRKSCITCRKASER